MKIKEMRSYFLNILLLLSSILLSVSIAEVGFRIFIKDKEIKAPLYFPAKESELAGLPFELLSNGSECKSRCDFYINKLGMRNEEIEPLKSYDVFRIAVIGDSHTFGGIIFENTIPKELQKLLNNDFELKKVSGKRFEVVNAGIPTLNMKGIYYFYHYKVRQIQPDLVFYLFHTNDFEEVVYSPFRDNSGKTYFVAYPAMKYSGDFIKLLPRGIEDFMIRNSFFYRYICYVLDNMKSDYKSRFSVVHPQQLKYLDLMFSEAKEDNSLFVVSVLGTLQSMSSCAPDDFVKGVTDLFLTHSRKLGLNIVDISEVLCGIPIEQLDRGDHGHFSDYANTLLSKRIYEQLRDIIKAKFL